MLLLLYCAVALVDVVVSVLPWWKTATFYQVYPRSFKDSNEDGIGDLRGITSKVDYLAELGISAIWINPINNSPLADFGYDVSDYRSIDKMYGNFSDLKELIDALHAKDLKILVDFVPNHSSDEHEWFTKSVNKEGNYTNYYVWKDAKVLENNTKTVPNNWPSVFTNSAWEWNEKRQQYYLHQFLAKQPDLNYRDPNLVNEMKEIVKFWLNLGIDGLRVDAVKYFVEDELFRDAPLLNPSLSDSSYYKYDRRYTENLPLTYEIMKEWNLIAKTMTLADGKERVMLQEVYDNVTIMDSYNGGLEYPFSICLNGDLIYALIKGMTARDFTRHVQSWLDAMSEGSTPNFLVSNHDNNRVVSKLGKEMADTMNMVLAVLPGIMVSYYGEELGMEDAYVTWEQTKDPSGLKLGKEHYLERSRDPARSPMQWDDTVNSGFCSANCTPWLPLSTDFWSVNVAAQKAAAKSHLKVYQSLMRLRKSSTFQSEKTQYQINATDDSTMGILRWADDDKKYLLIANFNTNWTKPLNSTFINIFKLNNITTFTVYCSSVNSGYDYGQKITVSENMILRPYSAVILQNFQSAASSIIMSSFLLSLSLSIAAILRLSEDWFR